MVMRKLWREAIEARIGEETGARVIAPCFASKNKEHIPNNE